ncbi:MAG: ribosome assembly cofactor RimP [Flavobacteriales bacterium]
MISKERVISLAKEKIEELNYFLVDVKISAKNEITVLFDKGDGVIVRDCLYVSRHIEGNLDRAIEDYQLTVCSPGLEKAFVVEEQYIKNIGRDVKVVTTDGDKIEGTLLEYGDVLLLETKTKQKGKKELLKQEVSIEKEKIKETKLIIKFK